MALAQQRARGDGVALLQGAVELNKSETNSKVKKLDAKISDLQAEIKHQVLHEITQASKTLDNDLKLLLTELEARLILLELNN